MTEPRRPAVAGAFYPSDGAALAKAVEAAFLDPRGPGELPTRHRGTKRTVRAIVVPHAGYVYSGPIAARAYARVAADAAARTILVLGVDHHGLGPGAALSDRPWLTPLGLVPGRPRVRDRALTKGPVVVDEAAHRREHSIEVRAPVPSGTPSPLRGWSRSRSVTPRSASSPRWRRSFARRSSRRTCCSVASTDFSHYVPRRDRPPPRRARDRRDRTSRRRGALPDRARSFDLDVRHRAGDGSPRRPRGGAAHRSDPGVGALG